MTKQPLRIYFYPDVPLIERAPFLSLIEMLKDKLEVTVIEVNDNHVYSLAHLGPATVWIIARQWRSAAEFLGAKGYRKGKIFISVLDLETPKETIYHVLAKSFIGGLPKNYTLLVHSPINFRFFNEMEKLPENQLRYLPLPLSEELVEKVVKQDSSGFTVGTFTSFNAEAQLNFIASVAHYVLAKNTQLKFRVLGSGPLYHHVIGLGKELELGPRFTVTECGDPKYIAELDALIYCPLRNDHFIPLYYGAQFKLPVVATEMSGIEEFIQDGKTGFIVPVNETKVMSELILRLASIQTVSSQMGRNLYEALQTKFSLPEMGTLYCETFLGQSSSTGLMEKAA